jgi:type I restriction enzyme S subunit
MLPEFLFYCLMGQYERNRQAGSGSQQPALNGSLVRAIEVPCPALDIQRKLIAELEMRFAQEAKLSLNLRERVKESRELRESLLYCAFSGQLVLQHVEDEPGAALSRHIRDAGAAPPRPSARSRRAVLVRE